MRQKLIACAMLKNELEQVLGELEHPPSVHWVERGLHAFPDQLRAELQTQVDAYSDAYDVLLLAYGFCGGALDGIVSKHAQIVLPLAHDCIQLLLSPQAEQADRRADTLYFTQTWTETDQFIGNEYAQYSARCGAQKAQRAYRKMLQEYRAMDLIDTGCYDVGQTAAAVRPVAELLGLGCGIVPGTLAPLRALLTGPWDTGFYVAEAGEALSLATFLTRAQKQIEKETNT